MPSASSAAEDLQSCSRRFRAASCDSFASARHAHPAPTVLVAAARYAASLRRPDGSDRSPPAPGPTNRNWQACPCPTLRRDRRAGSELPLGKFPLFACNAGSCCTFSSKSCSPRSRRRISSLTAITPGSTEIAARHVSSRACHVAVSSIWSLSVRRWARERPIAQPHFRGTTRPAAEKPFAPGTHQCDPVVPRLTQGSRSPVQSGGEDQPVPRRCDRCRPHRSPIPREHARTPPSPFHGC